MNDLQKEKKRKLINELLKKNGKKPIKMASVTNSGRLGQAKCWTPACH